ncbi:MGMT family protein [Chloroflexota bacterium]
MSASFSSPPDRILFNLQVWELVKKIPPGKVATYGQIASLIPPPEGTAASSYKAFSPRWVGGAMAACPDDVPWQRVINSQGKISKRPGDGHIRQRELLEHEGVVFDDRERVNLKQYGWKGPGESLDTAWRQATFDELI